ncbi:zinc finger protein 839 [Protopterus annectens]|uniref:zinc finger protein 839 n=1 Tax=Protopterus annectens TaxID=7888 RepID=UPI001CF9CCD8|nr:zinc finger protein 839 [Protopterus annectens]
MAEQDEEENGDLTTVVEDCRHGMQLATPESRFICDEVQSGCHGIEFLSKQITCLQQSIPEFVQVTTSGLEETLIENGQVVKTLAAGDRVLLEGSIINALGDPSARNGTAVSPDLREGLPQSTAPMETPTNTIIYIQPDGTFVEGTGLTPEEEQQLLEQLTKQHLVEVTENETQHVFCTQNEQLDSAFIQHTTLAPDELQQVIEQVTKSQHQVAQDNQPSIVSLVSQASAVTDLSIVTSDAVSVAETSNLPSQLHHAPKQQLITQPLNVMQNAAQHLQNVAHQVALDQNKANSLKRAAQHKLEAVHIQVHSGPAQTKERPIPPLAAIRPSAVTIGQPANKNTSTVNIFSPQIIKIQPVAGSGQQQYFLQSTSEPPIQLLVQRAPPPLAPVSAAHKMSRNKTVNGQTTVSTTVTVSNPISVVPFSATSLVSGPVNQQNGKLKQKKPFKVKTRSGRISRPPKYKAKDYKFIKTEDLVDGRQSDSDDYSELSVEEDEDEMKKDAAFSSVNYNLKPKTFKCESCEKAYIGRGGLARHYKLNPSHGKTDSLPQEKASAVSKPISTTSVEDHGVGDGNDTAARSGSPVVLINGDRGTLVCTKDTIAPSQEGMQVKQPLTHEPSLELHQPCLTHPIRRGTRRSKGPGRPRGPRRHGRMGVPGRPGYSVRRGTPGRPRNSICDSEHTMFRRKARLKELLQQCDNEELMELALPRLTQFITVYEFLLMKVEKGCPSRPYFPDVYREFEELHAMVKKMSEDHFNNSIFADIQKPLEVRDTKVAESLGITEELQRKHVAKVTDSSVECVITVGQANDLQTLAKKHGVEVEDDMLLPAKRIRTETLMENILDNYSGVKAESPHLNGLIRKEDVNQSLNRTLEHSENSYRISEQSTDSDHNIKSTILHSSNGCNKLIPVQNGAELSQSSASACQSSAGEAKSSKFLQAAKQNQASIGSTVSQSTEQFFSMERDISPEELVQDHLVGPNVLDQLTDTKFSSSVQSDNMHSMNSPDSDSKTSEHTGGSVRDLQNSIMSQDIQNNLDHSDQLNDSDIAEQVQQLERALSDHIIPIDHSYRTQHSEQQDTISQEKVESPSGNKPNNELELKNLGDLGETEEQFDGHMDIGSSVTVDETVEFHHELLPQEHEQIFIQTSEGLILSHPGTAVVSQSDGIVIVTDADGTTMHIQTQEGVPLETVEALLQVETEAQSESLFSQTSSRV